MRKLIIIPLVILFTAVVTLGISACQSDSPDTPKMEQAQDSNDAEDFMSSFRANLGSFLDHPLTTAQSRVIVADSGGFNPRNPNPGFTPVFFDTTKVYPAFVGKTITARQLMHFVQETGTELSLTDDGTFTGVFYFSNKEAEESLSPLVESAKQYLHSKGFSDTEISNMIAENNGTNADLIAFVLLLSEEEEEQANADPLDFHSNLDPSIFSSPYEEYAAAIDWGQVGRCGLRAIGFDIRYALAGAAVEAWTKATLMYAFKTVVKRALGPVGVAIAVVEFALCMSE